MPVFSLTVTLRFRTFAVAAIVIVTLTSSVNDYSKERQFKALNDTKEIPTVKVLRDGKKYKT